MQKIITISTDRRNALYDGKPGLSTWQNIFFCEFDGPREKREIAVTIIADN